MDDDSHHLSLGKALRQLRKKQGLSQEAFADKIGMHRAYYGAIERGAHNITIATLLRVCHGLEVPPSKALKLAGL